MKMFFLFSLFIAAVPGLSATQLIDCEEFSGAADYCRHLPGCKYNSETEACTPEDIRVLAESDQGSSCAAFGYLGCSVYCDPGSQATCFDGLSDGSGGGTAGMCVCEPIY